MNTTFMGLTRQGAAVFSGFNGKVYFLFKEAIDKKREAFQDPAEYKNRGFADKEIEVMDQALLLIAEFEKDHTSAVVQANIREGERAIQDQAAIGLGRFTQTPSTDTKHLTPRAG